MDKKVTEGFRIIVSDKAEVSPGHKNTTIVVLAAATKSIKLFKWSTYNRQLANTTVAEMARKQGQATKCQIPDADGQPYIITMVPPPQAGGNEVAPETLFKVFAIIRRKLEGPDAGRRIIYDGDLIHKFFGIGPGRALTQSH